MKRKIPSVEQNLKSGRKYTCRVLVIRQLQSNLGSQSLFRILLAHLSLLGLQETAMNFLQEETKQNHHHHQQQQQQKQKFGLDIM